MSSARRFSAPSDGAWQGRAFGLDISAPQALAGVPARNGHAAPGRTVVEEWPAAELDRWWRQARPVELVARHDAHGRVAIRVDHGGPLGYRVYAPYYGRHVVSEDGTEIRSAFPQQNNWRWQRLVFAQALPLAAALQGLELLHASAVNLDGRVVAFVASSGTGKSSVAAHLVAGGATFVTDDVLAVEAYADGVRAHPGPSFATLDVGELVSVSADARPRLGPEIGRIAKVFLAPPVASRPAPLDRIYFLERGSEGTGIVIERETRPDIFLGSLFLAYLRTPARLANHFAVCAALARSVAGFRVIAPRTSSAPAVADCVRDHIQETR